MKTLTAPFQSVKSQVLDLAKQYHIAYQETALDRWGGHVTRLADDQVALDPIEQLIIALARNDVLNRQEAVLMQASYLQEQEQLLV